MPPFPPIYIDGDPPCYRVKPWSRLPLKIESLGGSPGLEKSLLGGFFGEHSIAESSEADTENSSSVLLIKRPDRVGVPGGQPFHQADGIHRFTYATRPR